MFVNILWPVQATKVIEAAKDEAHLLDKELQHDLGYLRASDWSKAKSGERSPTVHRLLERAPASFLREFAYQILDAVGADDNEREDIERAIRAVRRLVRRREPLKADLAPGLLDKKECA